MPRFLALIGVVLLSQASAQLRVEIEKNVTAVQATMKVYDGKKMLWQATTPGLNAVTDSKFSANEKWLLNIADGNGYVQLWNVQTGERIRTFYSLSSRIFGASFTPDSQHFLLSFTDIQGKPDWHNTYSQAATFWSLKPLQQVATLDVPARESGYTDHVTFSADGNRMVFVRWAGYTSGPASIFNAKTGAYVNTISRVPYSVSEAKRGGAGATDARLSPNGQRVLVLYVNGELVEYDVNTARLLKVRQANTPPQEQMETFAQTGK